MMMMDFSFSSYTFQQGKKKSTGISLWGTIFPKFLSPKLWKIKQVSLKKLPVVMNMSELLFFLKEIQEMVMIS